MVLMCFLLRAARPPPLQVVVSCKARQAATCRGGDYATRTLKSIRKSKIAKLEETSPSSSPLEGAPDLGEGEEGVRSTPAGETSLRCGLSSSDEDERAADCRPYTRCP